MYNTSDIKLETVIIIGCFFYIWDGKLKSGDNLTLVVFIKSLKYMTPNTCYASHLTEEKIKTAKMFESHTSGQMHINVFYI